MSWSGRCSWRWTGRGTARGATTSRCSGCSWPGSEGQVADKEKTPRDQLEHLLGIRKRSTRYIGVVALTAALGIAATVGFAFTRAQNYRSETVLLYREVIPANLLRDVTTGGRNLAGQFREMVSARPILEP